MGRGGKREDAGRPLTAGELRKIRGLRASDYEWQLIQQFAKMVKHGDKKACVEFFKTISAFVE